MCSSYFNRMIYKKGVYDYGEMYSLYNRREYVLNLLNLIVCMPNNICLLL